MKQLPIILIYSRLVFAAAIIALSLTSWHFRETFIIILITLGLLSDIFDGIIARKLNVSTEKMRRLDSSIDQVFWVAVIASAIIIAPVFFLRHIIGISILAGLEAATYIISYVRFRKEVATHAIASKIWTLSLFALLIQLIATGGAGWLYYTCIALGILTRLEIISILLILRQWTNDVPSVYHALLLRKNKPIKRNKLFNG